MSISIQRTEFIYFDKEKPISLINQFSYTPSRRTFNFAIRAKDFFQLKKSIPQILEKEWELRLMTQNSMFLFNTVKFVKVETHFVNLKYDTTDDIYRIQILEFEMVALEKDDTYGYLQDTENMKESVYFISRENS